MGEQRRADLGGERRGVDDAARALADEMPSRDLVGQEYATRIDGEIEVPVRVGELKRAAAWSRRQRWRCRYRNRPEA